MLFLLAYRISVGISCGAALLATNSLSICLIWKKTSFHLHFETYFVWHRILGWHCFFFQDTKDVTPRTSDLCFWWQVSLDLYPCSPHKCVPLDPLNMATSKHLSLVFSNLNTKPRCTFLCFNSAWDPLSFWNLYIDIVLVIYHDITHYPKTQWLNSTFCEPDHSQNSGHSLMGSSGSGCLPRPSKFGESCSHLCALTGEGTAAECTRVAVGSILFFVRCWTEGLSYSLAVDWRPLSIPCHVGLSPGQLTTEQKS